MNHPAPISVSPETLKRLSAVVGPRGILREASDKAPYLKEWRDRWHGNTPLVLRPANTAEVSAILAIAHETATPIVPQSGNTGLVGGQIPHHGEILLSLDRMTRIIACDPESNAITMEAGATLKSVQDAAAAQGRLFPLSLASEGSCRIGGNLATNAGGLNVVAYGNARDLCLGLEVVLADGRIWNGLKSLRKDNTGYDMKQLFIGSEGTLGIITAASLKLYPLPRRFDTAFCAVPSPDAALQLLSLMKQETSNRVTTFELMPEIGLQFAQRHMRLPRPLESVSPWYVLMELSDAAEGVAATGLEQALHAGLVTDATIAHSDSQRQALWAIREGIPEAQKFEGGSIKHDVSVPLAKLPRFIAEATDVTLSLMPTARIVCFGHMGDGNMHFNVTQPEGGDKATFLSQWETLNARVHDVAHALGGSFSAEHGIGVLKRGEMQRFKSSVELDLMRHMKQALDPKGILNPGKLLP